MLAPNGSEGYIDSGRVYFAGRREAVLLIGLGDTLHNKQTANRKHETHLLSTFFVAEDKFTRGTKTERGNCAVLFKFLFIISMPAHALRSIVIQIKQAGIISLLGFFLNNGFK